MNSSFDPTKKQHFVPQYLLRNFAVGKKSKAKIWVFDKEKGRVFRNSVRNVGHENRFYEAESREGEKIHGEEWSKYVDSKGSNVVRGILDTNSIPREPEPWVDLLFSTAFQMQRCPRIRNMEEYVYEDMKKRWGEDVGIDGSDLKVGEVTKDDIILASIASMHDLEEIARLLGEKYITLALAPPESNFLISDNPVVKHNYIDHWPRGGLGLKKEGIEVYFPLSPRFCLQFTCPELMNTLRDTPYGSYWNTCRELNHPIKYTKENVEFVNSMQILQSERWVYAKNEIDLTIAKEMLDENSDIKIPASHKCIRN